MTRYEYKVLTAPTKGVKAPGRKSTEARYAHAVELLLNAEAADGWEYQRSDMLQSSERQGLTSSQTVYRTVMVFRRAVQDLAEEVIADSKAAAATADEAALEEARDAFDDAPAAAMEPISDTPDMPDDARPDDARPDDPDETPEGDPRRTD